MTTPSAIKDLTIQAINLLEIACLYPLHGANRTLLSETLAIQRLETMTFCTSHEAANASALADLAHELALARKLPTLVVITKYSPALFVFTLLLRRAGIHPRDVFGFRWTQAVFPRLSTAASEIARAPLLVVGSPALNVSWRMILALTPTPRHGRIITDADADAIPHLQDISRTFGVPVTMLSVTSPSQ